MNIRTCISLFCIALTITDAAAASYTIVARQGDPIPDSNFTMSGFHNAVTHGGGVAFVVSRTGGFNDNRLLWTDGVNHHTLVSNQVPVPIEGLVDGLGRPLNYRMAMNTIATEGEYLYFIASYSDISNKVHNGLFRFKSPDDPVEVIVPSTEALFDFTFTAANPPAMLQVRNGRILLGQNTGNQGFEAYILFDGEQWVVVADSSTPLPGDKTMRMENAVFADLSDDGERVVFIVNDDPNNPVSRMTYLYAWQAGVLTELASGGHAVFGFNMPRPRIGSDGVYVGTDAIPPYLQRHTEAGGLQPVPLPTAPPPAGRSGSWAWQSYGTREGDVDYFWFSFSGGDPSGLFRREADGSMTEVFNAVTSLGMSVFAPNFVIRDGVITLSVWEVVATTLDIGAGGLANPWLDLPDSAGWKSTALGWVHDAAFPQVYLPKLGQWGIVSTVAEAVIIIYLPDSGQWIATAEHWEGWYYLFGEGWKN